MKFLIDTNILISLEPAGAAAIEPRALEAAEIARLIQESANQVVVHPTVLIDLDRDDDADRRRHREHVLAKYPKLADPPQLTAEYVTILGRATPKSNDWVDNHLLVAVARDAVDCLVTQDQGIHRKAARLGITDRVLTVQDALAMLRALFQTQPSPPPAVVVTKSHNLDEKDPIFDSFRCDYPGFDDWLRKCKLAGRDTWVIKGSNGGLAAVCIVKTEAEAAYGMSGKILKICTFKVSEAYLGVRFGELLLKAVFLYAFENEFEWIYLTAFEKQAVLLAMLQAFGFDAHGTPTKLGELVLTKPGRPPDGRVSASPLEFAVRYGPCHLQWEGVTVWVVPIQPRWDRVLFPDRQEQTAMFQGQLPFGNALRKAYLCRSPVRTIREGDVLAFYRSETSQSVRTLGIVEGFVTSKDAAVIGRYVGRRTVYSMDEIAGMCAASRPVLALRFRQSLRPFDEVGLYELKTGGALKAAPQSIVRLSKEAAQWLRSRVGA